MSRLWIALTAPLLLASCARDPNERIIAEIAMRDSNIRFGEMLGIDGDSLVVQPAESWLPIEAYHFSNIDHILIETHASPALAGVAFGLAGSYVGARIGWAARSGTGDGAGFTEALTGIVIGGIAGYFLGASFVHDTHVPINSAADMQRLTKFMRYKSNYELREALNR